MVILTNTKYEINEYSNCVCECKLGEETSPREWCSVHIEKKMINERESI